MKEKMKNFMEFLLEDDKGFEKRFLSHLSEKEREIFENEIAKADIEESE